MGKFNLIKVMASIIVAVTLTFSGFVSVANAVDISGWQKAVGKKIAKKQTYPRAALRKELQGVATVEINVDREGNIVNHTLQKSTGYAILDKEVPKMMRRASPLPKPPVDVSDSQLTLVVPLSWRLQ